MHPPTQPPSPLISSNPAPDTHIWRIVLRQGLEVAVADGVYIPPASQPEVEIARAHDVLALDVGAESVQEQEPRVFSNNLPCCS